MNKDLSALTDFIDEYGDDLSILAYTLLGDSEKASEVVLDVLTLLWEKDLLPAPQSPKAFVFLHSRIMDYCKPLIHFYVNDDVGRFR